MTTETPTSRASLRTPRMSGTRRRLRLLSAVTGVLIAVGLLFAAAPPAAAHDQIVSSSPEAAGTVSEVPEQISLTFSGEILADFSAVIVEVIAADGQNIATGDPIVDGTTVTQAVQPGQVGVFTVRWRVVSSDGHPISNEYQYTVEAVAVPPSTPTPDVTEEPTPRPSPTATATPAGDVHNGPSGGGEIFPGLAVLGVVVVLGGGLIIVLMMGRERRRRDRAAAAGKNTRARKDEPADES
jgi:methionine-rich copper-binding protein CopC